MDGGRFVAAHAGGERIEARCLRGGQWRFRVQPGVAARGLGQNERGEWPSDNFAIRGTRFNQGVLLKNLLAQGADRIGDPTQAHMVAIDARAPLYDGGICTRVDCVSLGIMVNRDAQRFYDEGEDFWPKRYAIWGRLVALQAGQVGHSIIDAKAVGRFMPPVFKGAKADTLPALARQLACPKPPGEDRQRLQRRLPPRQFDHAVLDDCHTESLSPPRHTGRARSTRRRSTATRSSPASPSPTWA
jgi:tricarballylate dehydrogenase